MLYTTNFSPEISGAGLNQGNSKGNIFYSSVHLLLLRNNVTNYCKLLMNIISYTTSTSGKRNDVVCLWPIFGLAAYGMHDALYCSVFHERITSVIPSSSKLVNLTYTQDPHWMYDSVVQQENARNWVKCTTFDARGAIQPCDMGYHTVVAMDRPTRIEDSSLLEDNNHTNHAG